MTKRTHHKPLLLLFILICLVNFGFAQDFTALDQLVGRRVPTLKNKVQFLSVKGTSADQASYQVQNDKLLIKANSVSAAAVALNQYLKNYCNSSFSHTGDHVQIPAKLPVTGKPININSKFQYRYALNYCTYNYTMSFWKWEEWEKELDWMALNGVNLMLAPIGTEEVWQKTLTELGFTDSEIRSFLPGPAFNAWWLMGNHEGWGGPVSDNMIKHWTALQQKMLPRMKELGIQPVVQSFWGMVPSTLKNHYPDAKIVNQGKWLGLFQRPWVLSPDDPLFDKMANIYYKNFKSLYGSDFKYFGGDLFHEGGVTKGLDVPNIGVLIQKNMQQHFPGAIWLLQGWQDNPKEAMIKNMDPKHTLILDLLGDRGESWEKRNGYNQFPWIWTTVNNYGGREGIEGKLLRVITEPKRAREIKEGQTIAGIGIIPEGIETNAIIYDWMLGSAWQQEFPVQKNLSLFIKSRYGADDANLNESWQYLLQSAYISHPAVQAGSYESILCGRPDTVMIKTISCCGPTILPYNPETLMQAAVYFSKSAAKFKNVQTYQNDLVDIWRNVISLQARKRYEGFMNAFKRKDQLAFSQNKDAFIQLLLLQDRWVGTQKNLRIGTWINRAKDMMPDAADKKLSEWNARTQLTYWGPDDRRTMLNEYANKEWQGILKDLYLQRWLKFFEYAEAKMKGNDIPYPDFFEMEKKWNSASNVYGSKPEGDLLKMLDEVSMATGQSFQTADSKNLDFFKKP